MIPKEDFTDVTLVIDYAYWFTYLASSPTSSSYLKIDNTHMKTHSFLGGSGCHANMISATLLIQYNTLLLWLDCVNSPLKCRSRLLYRRLPCVLVHTDSAVPPRIGRGVNSPIQREDRPPQMWQYLPTLKNAPTQHSVCQNKSFKSYIQ